MVLVLGFVPMQAWAQGAAASVSVNGTVVGTYETLEDAFEAVDLCDAEDNVVITLLQDITVEQSCDVYSGVFTLDLNGHEMNNAEDSYCVLQIYNADTTIVDSVGTGLISGKENAILSRGGSLTITGGSFTADSSAIYANSCESVTITGGSFGGNTCISAYTASVEITGGSFNADGYNIYSRNGDLSITGGIFSTNYCNLRIDDSTVVLNVGDDGTGATFLRELYVDSDGDITLDSMLGEGAAYWQGDVMVIPTENQWEITGGDVVIKTACTHENGTLSDATDNADGKTHSFTWDCCGAILVENHGKESILEIVDPDCEQDGYTRYYCRACGAGYQDDTIPASGHAFGEDGICANCGADEAKKVTITMMDECADSWNGAAIDIYENGSLMQQITCVFGEETFSFFMKSDAYYKFLWCEASYDEECAFTITIGGEVVCHAGFGECAAYEDGQILYPICDHDFVYSGGSAPTCDLSGYTAYVCSLCGEPKEEEIPALGHDFGEDGICTICGGDYENYMVIHMVDDYGDSWNGNGIAVLEDGEEIDIATIEDGYTATWGYMLDPDKEYTLLWIAGDYPYECSFRITIGDTTVYEVSDQECQYFEDGHKIYPPCDHELEIVDVVEATCTENGYTIYQCSLCGSFVKDDYVLSPGHTLGSEGEVTLPTCTEEGYTTYICESCGESFVNDYVDPLGHTPSGNAEVIPVQCLNAGVTIDTCVDCGEPLYSNYIPETGHTLGEDGNCTVCGEPYKLQLSVAGVEVTYENYQDILGDGTAFYDPATNTLTLKDFVYENDYPALYVWMPINFVLEGTSVINSDYAAVLYAECGSYHFGGSGSLLINSAYNGICADAEGDVDVTFGGDISITFTSGRSQPIYVEGSTAHVTVEDNAKLFLGTAECPLIENGLQVGSNTFSAITITDNALVEAVAGEYNVKALCMDYDNGNLIVSGNATVNSNGGGGVSSENVTISGGKVSITVEDYMVCLEAKNLTVTGGDVELISGIESISLVAGETVISGGSVVAKSDYAGIISDKLTVSGGSLTASGGTYGISTSAGCDITGGRVTVLDGGLFSMMSEGVEGDAVTLGESMQILQPQGAVIGVVDNGSGVDYGVLTEDGEYVASFVIGCGHDWEDGACVHCGEALTVKAEFFTISFENEILVNFYYSSAAAGTAEEHGVLEFREEPQEVSYEAATIAYISEYIPETDLYMSQSDGFPAKEMGDKRYYAAYVKLADGTYIYSDAYAYCPVDYAYNKLADENADLDLKALCVAMLNYGAEAQKYFGYRTDSLMNAGLTEEQKALVADFDWGMLIGAEPSDKDTVFEPTGGFASRQASVSFEGALAINYYFTPSVDADNMTLYYWSPSIYEWVDALTPETSLGYVQMEKQANGSYWTQLTHLPAKWIDDTIYVAATYEKDGVTYCTGIIPYSVCTYCSKKADGPMGGLAFATAAYGYYADAYFA